ncbi:cytochrome c3 family protein [Donghicola tyrosinivorans]|uniref:Cytochrome c7-like protein n=1 Tax=Donghicola tyrosinivorans TaxID=1652492 RepID=A0A2T0W9G3_9RHOB|nr:cytochrome c3 family protein [Donghicola tyrosinivorans]PRY83355.1 cytochrome c7-like protein [Donghicola tyrosinivorans]
MPRLLETLRAAQKTFSRKFAICIVLSCAITGAANAQSESAQDPAAEPETITPFVLPKSGPFEPSGIKIENNAAISDWFRSAHARSADEAFRHWDEEGEVDERCASCHSGEGFRDFHGLDGTTVGAIDGTIDTGGVVDCGTCHNAGLADVREISFPSGLVHPVTGVEAACLTCHQGRNAGRDVSAKIDGLPLDTPDASLRFINPHYATAGATWLGGYGAAGYHYDGHEYSGRFFHARPVATCNSCHEPHTLEVAAEPCQTCHLAESIADIRIARQSYDGSGNLRVGIKSDIEANAATLMAMIEAYTDQVADSPVIYDGSHYPYFFADQNRDGAIDTADGQSVAYASWTPRSLRAAFNWKLVTADPGNFAHNPVYVLELLHDSIMDLGTAIGIDVEKMNLRR